MSKPSSARYPTTRWSSYIDALRRRGPLLIWFDKEMTWLASHHVRPGRPSVFSDAAIQFCLTMKFLFKLVAIVAPLMAWMAPTPGVAMRHYGVVEVSCPRFPRYCVKESAPEQTSMPTTHGLRSAKNAKSWARLIFLRTTNLPAS